MVGSETVAEVPECYRPFLNAEDQPPPYLEESPDPGAGIALLQHEVDLPLLAADPLQQLTLLLQQAVTLLTANQEHC